MIITFKTDRGTQIVQRQRSVGGRRQRVQDETAQYRSAGGFEVVQVGAITENDLVATGTMRKNAIRFPWHPLDTSAASSLPNISAASAFSGLRSGLHLARAAHVGIKQRLPHLRDGNGYGMAKQIDQSLHPEVDTTNNGRTAGPRRHPASSPLAATRANDASARRNVASSAPVIGATSASRAWAIQQRAKSKASQQSDECSLEDSRGRKETIVTSVRLSSTGHFKFQKRAHRFNYPLKTGFWLHAARPLSLSLETIALFRGARPDDLHLAT